MDRRLFGTDGIRGKANQAPMTVEVAMRLGKATAYLFRRRRGHHRIVIGKDTRLSGYMFEAALTAGICSMGVDVLLVGPMPTPAIAFLTRSLRADAGVVISASHNPFDDNGIKIFSEDGMKLPDALEAEIESLMASPVLDREQALGERIGKAHRIDDAEGRYIEFVKAAFPRKLTLEGLRVVVDCANGAAYKITPSVLRELGAQVYTLGDRPNGLNINRECGSLHPERLQEAVRTHGAHLGLAHDGDADRVILVDERGQLVDGDAIMAMCALDFKARGILQNNTLVTTVMSNLGLEIAMREAGIQTLRTPVGDRYVLETMLQVGANLGGEPSGHVIFLDHNTTGDGLITALQVLRLVCEQGKPLSEVAQVFTPCPQVLRNVRVREKRDFQSIPSVAQVIQEAQQTLEGRGRLLVRYSGTESKARIMVEGEDEGEIHRIAERVAQALEEALGENQTPAS